MSKTILVIDDNIQNVSLLKVLLEHASYAVMSAPSAAEGIALAKQGGITLIIMDIQMPEMDGIQAAHALSTDELTRDIPIVGTSAFASLSVKQRALRSGMIGFIEKPINREQFISQIEALLQAR